MVKATSISKNIDTILLLVLWIAIFAMPVFLIGDDEGVPWNKIYATWVSLLPFFALFLVNHFLLIPVILFKKRKALYFITVIIAIGVVSATMFYIERDRRTGKRSESFHRMPPPARPGMDRPPHNMGPGHNPQTSPFPYPPYVKSMLVCLLLVGFDTGLRSVVYWSKLEQERTLLEKENVQNQLAFLRNQVSPHFLMNTLNNIHILIDLDTEEAKDSVIKLSKLMRHLLYESNENLVSLERELEFITSYINLMKLRYSDKVDIKLELPEEVPSKKIPPLLFTSFVENAFKHGVSYQHKSFIYLRFTIKEDKLNFLIRNSKAEAKRKSSASGIGIANSVKRLDILYGKDYILDISDEENEYKLKLSIPV